MEPADAPAPARARVHVLGPTRLVLEGVTTPLTLTAAQRTLLARLAVTPRRSVDLAALFDALWPVGPPATARAALHNQISRLRAVAGTTLIETTTTGYALSAWTDLEELRDLVARAEQELTSDPAAALARAEGALDLARGEPFSDLGADPSGWAVRREVEVLLAAAGDFEVEASLALGLSTRALAGALRLCAESPLDERRAAAQVRALAMQGRRGDAIAEAARFRRAVRTELGVEPGARFAAVELEVLGRTDPRRRLDPVLVPSAQSQAIVDAVETGDSVLVVGTPGAGVSATLRAVTARLRAAGMRVATAAVRGEQDVAVAPVLDLLEELDVAPYPPLGPLGVFVPALQRLAGHRAVALVVDDADLAGPSTRWALWEASRVPGVRVVAGLRAEPPADLSGLGMRVVVLPDPPPPDTERLRQMFRALPEAVRRTVSVVALAPWVTPVAAMEELEAGTGVVGAVASGLVRSVTVDGVEGFELAYETSRSMVRDETPAGVRTELHHAWGRLLQEQGRHEEALRPLLAAAELAPEAAARAVRRAAARAGSRGAHLDAVACLRRGVDRLTGLLGPGELLGLRIELGDALRLAGDAAHEEVLARAVAQAGATDDLPQLADALFAYLQLGRTTVSTELSGDVAQVVEHGISRLTGHPDEAVVLAAASLAFSMTGNAARCRDLFDRAELLAVDQRTRARVLPMAYMALGAPHDLPRRARYAAELVAAGSDLNLPAARFEGLQMLFTVLLQRGHGAELRECQRQMTETVDLVGDVGRRWALHYQEAALAHLAGDLTESERLSHAAFAQFGPVAESRATSVLFGQLFGLALARGTVPELAPLLSGLVAEQPGVPAWSAALALSLATSEPDEALRCAQAAVAEVEVDFSWLAAQMVTARACAQVLSGSARRSVARRDLALDLLARCTERLEPHSGLMVWQGTCSYGPVDTTLALAARARGEDRAARDLAVRAHEQAERLQAPVFVQELRRLDLLG